MKSLLKALKTSVLVLVALGISADLAAQRKTGRSKNVDIWMGAAVKKTLGKSMSQLLVSNSSGFVTHSFFNQQEIYTAYDTTLQPVGSTKFDRLQSDKAFVRKGFIRLKEKAVLLTGQTLHYDKANVVYLSAFDQESLKVDKPQEVARITGNGFHPNFNSSHLNFAVSPDGNKFVVYFIKARRADKLDDPTQHFRFMSFDVDLTLLWEQDVTFESENIYLLGGKNWQEEVAENAIGIDNSGIVYCWGRTDKGDGYDHDKRFNVKLSKISADGHESIALSGDQSRYYREWNLEGAESGMIMAANYMEWGNTTKSWVEKSDGFAFVNWSGAIKQRPIFKNIEFSDEYMTMNQSKSIKKRVQKLAKGPAGAFEVNFEIKGFQKLDDENYLVMAETHLDSTIFNAHTEKEITTYMRKDAQFFSVNSRTGKLNWNFRIPKHQQNKTADGMGYVCKVVGEKMYVIFNDHFDNTEKEWTPEKGVSKFSKKENPVVMLTIDINNPTQPVKRETLWKSEKVKTGFETINFYSTANTNEGLIYLDDPLGKDIFVRLGFK
ncbi:hypothetical protein OAL15_00210 [Flavobacteriales bacterium]|nr:hypothetical protein [Flavobacteriales bacterium]